MRNSVAQAIFECARRDKSVFLITGDAGFGVLDDYQSQFGDRFLNLGVAEQNMISFSAGLALTGYKVFVYNIAPFVLYRCYEQVRNDICYQQLPVTLVGVGSGLAYAPGGMTHYAIEDVGLARTMPNLTILSPGDPGEAAASLEFAYQNNQPAYIRISKTGEPAIHTGPVADIRRPQLICQGSKVAVLFHGAIGPEVLKAAQTAAHRPTVLSIPMLAPFDGDGLSNMLTNIKTIITVEEHYIRGGLGTIVSEWVVRERAPWHVRCMGIPDEFVHIVRKQQGMWEHYGITSNAIRRQIEESWNNG